MAEEERLTKAERRERKREERRREKARQARRQTRRRILTGLGTVAILALVGTVIWQAFAGQDELSEPVALTAEEVTAARTSASCEIVDRAVELDQTHLQSADQAPPLAQVYPRVRPSHGGPHLAQAHPLVTDGSDRQLSEFATTHNLEHGSVIMWYDPEAVGDGVVGEMEAWSERLNESGFANLRGGSGIFVSPYTDPGLPEGTAVAMRAWGVAMDCGEWSETTANAFVLQYFGTHGIAPEAPNLGPYPADTVVWDGEPLPGVFDPGWEPTGSTETGSGETGSGETAPDSSGAGPTGAGP